MQHHRALGILGQGLAQAVDLFPDVEQGQVQVGIPAKVEAHEAAAEQGARGDVDQARRAGHRLLDPFGDGAFDAVGRHVRIGRPDDQARIAKVWQERHRQADVGPSGQDHQQDIEGRYRDRTTQAKRDEQLHAFRGLLLR